MLDKMTNVENQRKYKLFIVKWSYYAKTYEN